MPRKPGGAPTVTHQFCGAGGCTIASTRVGMVPYLALNHWPRAIETHQRNFPNTRHDCTDVSACDPRRYPSTDGLITSPECTNHSLAKGKARPQYTHDLFGTPQLDPAAERSRATMWDVPRFAEVHDYNFIVVENVIEAATWVLFPAWLKAMHLLGYRHQIVYFNSMFAPPTPQSRDRMYVVFTKEGNPVPDLDFRPAAYCHHCDAVGEAVQTWKQGRNTGRYRRQYVYTCSRCRKEIVPFYFAALNIIDWTLPAERIGDRKRPLKPKTMARIEYGLQTHGRKPLIITGRYTSGVECRVRPAAEEPLPTQPGDSSHAILAPYFVEASGFHAGAGRVSSGLEPMGTQTTRQTMGVVGSPFFVHMTDSSGLHGCAGNDALPTQTCTPLFALVSAGFLSKQYGGQADPRHLAQGLDTPTGTITTWDHHALVGTPPMFVSVNEFDPRVMPAATEAMGTQTTQDKWAFAAALPPAFIAELHGTSKVGGLEEELMCVTTGRNHALVSSRAFMTYYYGAKQASGMGDPLRTVTAVDRAGLVQALEGMTVDDLTFRMLTPNEIGRAMAFPDTYIVTGNGRERTKQYGNAVTPPVMEMILERLLATLNPRQV